MRELKISTSITDRSEESLRRYLLDISNYRLIDAEEEIRLARKIKAGDQAAMQKLVTANLRFVVSCAKKYGNLGLGLNDLVNEGNIGLIKAASLFDETKGFKFISYAVWWVRQAIINSINANSRTVRLPSNQLIGIKLINDEAQRLEQLLERNPTLAELSDAVGKKEKDITEHFQANLKVQYLDDPIPGGETDLNCLINFIPDENEDSNTDWINIESRRTAVDAILGKLRFRDRRILEMFFGLYGQQPLNEENIAHQLGLSKERVRQLKSATMAKLKADQSVILLSRKCV